ncbi:MAG: 30S ribosomal protein S5 [bacterium]|nr:30S ribosomal protein S5 [bacterium]
MDEQKPAQPNTASASVAKAPAAKVSAPVFPGSGAPSARPQGDRGFGAQGGGHRFGGQRRRMPFPDKKMDEFQEKTLDIRRVTRVVAGGKRMRFRVTMVVGDAKGRVGVGIAKGLDVAGAIDKAKTAARKNVFLIPLKGRTIPHEVEAKFSAARIRLKPAIEGHGLRAGGAARTVLSLAGIRDVVAKTLGRTPNKLTNALATMEALKQLRKSKIK